jgi:hypothetical protein
VIPEGWTAIAWRPRTGGPKLEWRAISGAPLRLTQAKRMAERGALLMANRHFWDRVELVVRARDQGSGTEDLTDL